MSYGGYNGAYPPMYGQQQLLANYPANNYYGGAMNPYGSYPNSYMGANAAYYGYGSGSYGGYGGYGGYGSYGGYGGYGSGYGGYGNGMYLPYKPSTLRNIFNRIRHGSSYNYYPNYGYEYGGRHRGSWIE